ncbi:c-type cytochrome [Massilia sp. TS11]|uniref:c-type cytochrome n=1 Tax=Massilia sp. TS11 TaxID=2908003 RepID=UPI001EDC3207|nr:c-type cytochrome [Massilia sp. TS11]MCG2584489.1 c-type cytochrome [Massilia sp. TS11]
MRILLISLLAVSALVRAAPVEDSIAQRAVACAACHGKEGRATRDGFFPRIAGKPAGYLYNQLINFRDGRRQFPQMRHMVGQLSDDYLRELADYFAGLHPPYPPAQAPAVPEALLQRGQRLVQEGDAARKLPACAACHGRELGGTQPAVPGLLGLPRDYLNAQFGAWKAGTRRAAAPDCMAQVVRQLSDEDVVAVSAWLAAQPVPESLRPAAAAPAKPPLACGSMQP